MFFVLFRHLLVWLLVSFLGRSVLSWYFVAIYEHHVFRFFCCEFTSNNYSAWEFEFCLFVMGKELWGHIDGSDPAPTNVHKLPQWQTKDAWVMTWILG